LPFKAIAESQPRLASYGQVRPRLVSHENLVKGRSSLHARRSEPGYENDRRESFKIPAVVQQVYSKCARKAAFLCSVPCSRRAVRTTRQRIRACGFLSCRRDSAAICIVCTTETEKIRLRGGDQEPCSTMYSMAARSPSSLQLMQPPFGGMALSPLLTDENSASLPLAMRGAQASLSPSFGAPATPAA
jgi:hypothetical protein